MKTNFTMITLSGHTGVSSSTLAQILAALDAANISLLPHKNVPNVRVLMGSRDNGSLFLLTQSEEATGFLMERSGAEVAQESLTAALQGVMTEIGLSLRIYGAMFIGDSEAIERETRMSVAKGGLRYRRREKMRPAQEVLEEHQFDVGEP